jgi:hypothetical protein
VNVSQVGRLPLWGVGQVAVGSPIMPVAVAPKHLPATPIVSEQIDRCAVVEAEHASCVVIVSLATCTPTVGPPP